MKCLQSKGFDEIVVEFNYDLFICNLLRYLLCVIFNASFCVFSQSQVYAVRNNASKLSREDRYLKESNNIKVKQLNIKNFDSQTYISKYPINFPSIKPNFVIAAPENLNPGLKLAPEKEQEPEVNPKPKQPLDNTEKKNPVFVLESLTPDINVSQDNFGQKNLFFEETAVFLLRNGNKLKLKTGFNSFEQSTVKRVTNIPLQVGWKGKINKVNLSFDGGVDLFNRLPAAPNFTINAESPIYSKVSDGKLQSLLVGILTVEYKPYKFNAQTLENKITFWRIRPSFYWQINPNTSLFSLGQFGFSNDGNQEFQSFSRLEHKIGQLSVAANLFTWSFQQDLAEDSGYFSPPDFIVYNAEIAWKEEIFNFLSCKISATLGRQRLQGTWDSAKTYTTLCTAKFSTDLELDIGYAFSNVREKTTGNELYKNEALSGKLRIKL